jgi:hypothetical protein
LGCEARLSSICWSRMTNLFFPLFHSLAKVREVVAGLEGRARGVVISGGNELRRGEETAVKLAPKTCAGLLFRGTPKDTIKKWRVAKKGPYEVVEYLNDSTIRVRHIESGAIVERAVSDI